MSINIDGSNDPSYRYQMPRILGKVEGRGNGIRTALPNVADVARALKRSPEHITKFYGCELGAQSRYDEVVRRPRRARGGGVRVGAKPRRRRAFRAERARDREWGAPDVGPAAASVLVHPWVRSVS